MLAVEPKKKPNTIKFEMKLSGDEICLTKKNIGKKNYGFHLTWSRKFERIEIEKYILMRLEYKYTALKVACSIEKFVGDLRLQLHHRLSKSNVITKTQSTISLSAKNRAFAHFQSFYRYLSSCGIEKENTMAMSRNVNFRILL